MKALLVLENPYRDRYIAHPIVTRLLDHVGLRARLDVLMDPFLDGIEAVVRELPGIAADNRMVQLILVVVDRDANTPHDNLARIANACSDPRVVSCAAIEEIEAWLVALHRERVDGRWPELQSTRGGCKAASGPLLSTFKGPGGGRVAAMRDLGAGWKGLLHLCDEIQKFGERIAAVARPPAN